MAAKTNVHTFSVFSSSANVNIIFTFQMQLLKVGRQSSVRWSVGLTWLPHLPGSFES